MDFLSLRRIRKGKQSFGNHISKPSQQQLIHSQESLDSSLSNSSQFLQISNPKALSPGESSEFFHLHRQREGSLVPVPMLMPISASRSTPNIHKLFKASTRDKDRSTGQKQKQGKSREKYLQQFELKNTPSISDNSISVSVSSSSLMDDENDITKESDHQNKKSQHFHQSEAPSASTSLSRSTSIFERNRSRSNTRSRSPSPSPASSLVSVRSHSSGSGRTGGGKKPFEFKAGNLTKFVSLVANGSSASVTLPPSQQSHHRTQYQVNRSNSKSSLSNFSGGSIDGELYTKNSKLKAKRSQRSSPAQYKRSGSGRALNEIQDVIQEHETSEHCVSVNSNSSIDRETEVQNQTQNHHQLHPSMSMVTISSSIASSNTSISSSEASSSSTMPLPHSFNLQRRNSSGSVNINLRNKEDTQNSINNNNSKGPAGGQFMSLNRPKKSLEEIKIADAIIQGIKRFNRDPSKGMEFLIKNQIVGSSAEDVAKFLKKGENLSKTAIGTYLGEFHEFNQQVLSKFVELHDFTEQHFVTSLRQFLWSFRLPGEAQKIDRMMECFAQHYCTLNPDVFSCTDTCYIISFATIMLNTTLHNPNVKDKPSVEQFISMNRDIDNGKSLDPIFLTSLYVSIRNEEFQIPKEEGNDLNLTFYNPDIKGWLWKQGARYKNWTRRWFILSNNVLYYFKNSVQDKSPRGIIPLENIDATQGSFNGKYFTFILSTTASSIKSCKTLSNGTLVLGTHSVYVLGTEVEEERTAWIQSIQQNRSFDDYYTLLQEKKNKMIALSVKLREKKNLKKHGSTVVSPIRKSQIGMPINRPKTQVVNGIEVEVDDLEYDAFSLTDNNENAHENSPEAGDSISNFSDEIEDDDNSSLILRMTLDQPNRDQDELSLRSNSNSIDIDIDRCAAEDIDVTMGTELLEEIPPTPFPLFVKPAQLTSSDLGRKEEAASISPCSVQIHVSDTDRNICEIGSSQGQGHSLQSEQLAQCQFQGQYPQSKCVISINSDSADSDFEYQLAIECMSETETEISETPLEAVSVFALNSVLVEACHVNSNASEESVEEKENDLSTLVSISVDDTPKEESNIFVFPSSPILAGNIAGNISLFEVGINEEDQEGVDSVFLDEVPNTEAESQLITDPATTTKKPSEGRTGSESEEKSMLELEPIESAEPEVDEAVKNRISQSRNSHEIPVEVLQLQVSTANIILESSC